MENLYCKIFVDSERERDEMVDEIVKITGGEKNRRRGVKSDCLDIDVNENDEYDKSCDKNKSDAFLYFKYFLDVDPVTGTDRDVYISNLREMVKELKTCIGSSVPASDFEDELI